eukprot:gene8797-10425_t
MMSHPNVLGTIGLYFVIYKPEYRAFAGYHMIFKVLQTSAVVSVSQLCPEVAVLYAILVTAIFMCIDAYVGPYLQPRVNLFQALFHGAQVQTLVLVAAREATAGIDSSFMDLTGIYVGLVHCALFGAVLYYLFMEYKTLVAVRLQKVLKSNLLRGTMIRNYSERSRRHKQQFNVE